MAEITHLKPVTKPVVEVDADLIARIENLLEMARDGRMQGIAYVMLESTGMGVVLGVGTGWDGSGVTSNVHATIGALQVLQRRLVDSLDDEDE